MVPPHRSGCGDPNCTGDHGPPPRPIPPHTPGWNPGVIDVSPSGRAKALRIAGHIDKQGKRVPKATFEQAIEAQRAGYSVLETLPNGDERRINFDRRRERELAASVGKLSGRQRKKLRRQIRQVAAVQRALKAGHPNPLCGVTGCRIAERHVHAPAKPGGDVA